jgi:hypothetical protein
MTTHLRHDTSSSDSDTSTDRNVRQHHHLPAKPAVIADSDGTAEFGSGGSLTDGWVERVRGGVTKGGENRVNGAGGDRERRQGQKKEGKCHEQLHVGTEKDTSADGDLAGVERDEAKVDEGALADAA